MICRKTKIISCGATESLQRAMDCILDVSTSQRGKASWRLLLYLGSLVFRKRADAFLLSKTEDYVWDSSWLPWWNVNNHMLARASFLHCRFWYLPPSFVHTSLNLCTSLFISFLFSLFFFLSPFSFLSYFFKDACTGVAEIAFATSKSRKPRATNLHLKFTLFTVNLIKYDWYVLTSLFYKSEEEAT